MSNNLANRLKRLEETVFGGKADEYRYTCFRFNLRQVGTLVLNETIIALIEGQELPSILADRLYAPIPQGTPQNIIEEICRDDAGGRYDTATPKQWQDIHREAIKDRCRFVNLYKDRIEGFHQHGWTTLPKDIEDERSIIKWIESEFGPVEPEQKPEISECNEGIL